MVPLMTSFSVTLLACEKEKKPNLREIKDLKEDLAKIVKNDILMSNLILDTKDNLFIIQDFLDSERSFSFGNYLHLPEMQKVLKYTKIIGDNAFFKNNYLATSLVLPECISIGEYAFCRNKSIKTIIMPKCKTIRRAAFNNIGEIEKYDFSSLISVEELNYGGISSKKGTKSE